ncbi:MAG TPA: TetR/AcrR family transcriptional regulator [Chakrabartia sp.]|jgi:AcrR family transcriptional regulator|nr:TetR/AcrR family transcriptional regulator [Chakrabartia sp.]
MLEARGIPATMEPNAKTPRTERGRKTLRAILDAAAAEFGEKGFYESSIVGITSRAGVALGSFYTYFDSKDAIFRALVRDMSAQVGRHAAAAMREEDDALTRESRAFLSFLEFTRGHKEIYRIIDEAEFADPESHRLHYESTAARILARLQDGAAKGEVRADVNEAHAWALMGMNVFLGLRFGVWNDSEPADHVAALARDFVAKGLGVN